MYSAVLEQLGHDAVCNCCTDLALDIISNDRQASLDEALLPIRLRGDKDRDAVDEAAAGFQHLFNVPFCGHFRTDRQVTHDNIGLRVF